MNSPFTGRQGEPLSRGKLLVVDDEASVRWALRLTLRRMGFDLCEAGSGEEALALLKTVRFDAVLLDIHMPGMTGVQTCQEIRRLLPALAILMVTVRSEEQDKIEALDAGADDYITKPFNVGELGARIRAAIRRSHANQSAPSAVIHIGDIELDPPRRTVRKAGAPIRLTPKEYDLLYYMMSNAGLCLPHARLLSAVWGPEYQDQVEYLRTFVRQLRKKLGDDAARPIYLVTDSHIGYRFNSGEDISTTSPA